MRGPRSAEARVADTSAMIVYPVGKPRPYSTAAANNEQGEITRTALEQLSGLIDFAEDAAILDTRLPRAGILHAESLNDSTRKGNYAQRWLNSLGRATTEHGSQWPMAIFPGRARFRHVIQCDPEFTAVPQVA